jgi:hypothetical protein
VDGDRVAETNRSAPIEFDIGYEKNTLGVHANLDRLFLEASIDEVRISTCARSPEWVKLSFENQRLDNSKLLVF